MNTKLFEFGVRKYQTQSPYDFNLLSAPSSHHSSYHHEHSAH